MDNEILWFAIAILAAGLALNLKLSIAVMHAARREREQPVALQPGESVPNVNARALQQGGIVHLPTRGNACVLLFMSSKCPSCLEVLPELEALMPSAEQAGLEMWLVSLEPAWRVRRFLNGSGLLARVANVKLSEYRQLNANLISPAYAFVNHEGKLEATGFIRDPHWQSLCEQLKEVA